MGPIFNIFSDTCHDQTIIINRIGEKIVKRHKLNTRLSNLPFFLYLVKEKGMLTKRYFIVDFTPKYLFEKYNTLGIGRG